VDYYKECVDISIPDFYKELRASKTFPKTSLPSVNDYVERFTSLIKQGKDIICVCLSSYFSGSYNSAVNAREIILENYPDSKIAIIDSLNATAGQGLLVQEIAYMIRDNVPYEKIIEIASKLREKARIFFFVDTLDYLEHGGRIGKVAALLGTVLNVKPLIYLQDGLLNPNGKIRGSKKAISRVVDDVKEYVSGHENDYHYAIAHADKVEYAELLADLLYQEVGVHTTLECSLIGTTIGVNTGPDTAGICVIEKYQNLL
jgi:DegV family protein with EDD domain